MRIEIRIALFPVALFCCFFGAICFGGEPLKENDNRKAVWFPAVGSEPKPRETVVFSGTTFDCKWLIRNSEETTEDKVSLDIFQLLSATAAPVKHREILAENVAIKPNHPAEINYQFQIPKSDRPVRYLLKLWKEKGDKRTPVSLVLLNAIPSSVLNEFKGLKIYGVGFDEDATADWTKVLIESGIEWDTAETLQSLAKIEGNVVVFVSEAQKKSASDPRKASSPLKGKTVIYFRKRGEDTFADRIYSSKGKGTIVWTKLSILDSLKSSAWARMQLAEYLKENPTPENN